MVDAEVVVVARQRIGESTVGTAWTSKHSTTTDDVVNGVATFSLGIKPNQLGSPTTVVELIIKLIGMETLRNCICNDQQILR